MTLTSMMYSSVCDPRDTWQAFPVATVCLFQCVCAEEMARPDWAQKAKHLADTCQSG